MKRRTVVFVVAAGPLALSALGAPPLRNLTVELRWVDAEQRSTQEAAAGGGVVVGTGGVVDARGSAVLRAGERRTDTDQVQRLTVLNGGRAGVRLAQSLPVQWLDVAVTPRGPAAVLRQGWMDAGVAFDLRVQWPGGHAPVRVEVAQQTDGPPAGAGVAGTSGGLFTTLQLALNEWATVAESAGQHQAAERGTLSTSDIAGRQRRLLQMRVSLP
jgi:hypothetical protein